VQGLSGEHSAPAVPVGREVRCEIGFVAARVRLLSLLHVGFLHVACALAYESALAVHYGRARSRLVPAPLVSVGEPAPERAAVTVPVRCTADDGSGRLDRVLEAELAFRAMAGSTAIRFDGVFRLPGVGGHIERAGNIVALPRAADSGAEFLLTQITEALIWVD
jgi:hypothetical protein